METMWMEAHFGKDKADYDRWETARDWFRSRNLYARPSVRHDFDDSGEFDQNVYAKGGFVLCMLRNQLGEAAFYAGLKHYLEVHRGKNVVTADLTKAIEEATHTNVDQFFDQWVHGAGAPKFEISYNYDAEKKQVALAVKQTQKVEGRVGLFRVPVNVEITNATGPKLYPVVVSKADETFTFPSESTPQLVIFDKGTQVLKSAEFKKEKKELLYQLKNAGELADHADAAVALGKLKGDDEAADALGEVLRNDKTEGVRLEAAKALGDLNSPAAAKQLLNALDGATEAELRETIVQSLGFFKENAEITAKLELIAREDSSYRARAAALGAIGRMKIPKAYETLTAAVSGESPDGFLRNAALRGLGSLAMTRLCRCCESGRCPGKSLLPGRRRLAAWRGCKKTTRKSPTRSRDI